MFGAIPGLLSEQFAPETILKICWVSLLLQWLLFGLLFVFLQFNFRRQWYKSGKTVKDLRFAAPLFPLTPIVGGLFCIVTCISMVFDPSMQVGFICCIIFILLCYVSYFIFYRKRYSSKTKSFAYLVVLIEGSLWGLFSWAQLEL